MMRGRIKPIKLLLPFTDGIDMQALEVAIHLAQSRDATLVALALFHVAEKRRDRGIRSDKRMQGQDFLEIVQAKATKQNVTVECCEVTTEHIAEQVITDASTKDCGGVLLFVRAGKGLLLHTHEIKALLEMGGVPLYLVHLPVTERSSGFSWIIQHFFEHFSKKRSVYSKAFQEQESAQSWMTIEHIDTSDKRTRTHSD